MSNDLTDKNFWANYWESKQDLAFVVPPKHTFHQIFRSLIESKSIKSAIELGGFPGYYAIFLKKYFNVDTTLFDFYIHPKIMQEVFAANGLDANSINVVEGDLFKYEPSVQYDLVLSCGLIEHFNDTTDIIARHLTFLKPGGTLLITIPNFTGVNGWVQQKFDRDNYDKHNISCMYPDLLSGIATKLGLEEVRSTYYGYFSVWLENRKEKPALVTAFVKLIWYAGKLLTKVIPFQSKTLSPYIVLSAVKPL